MYVCMYVCMCVCIYLYIYIYIYANICVYIHTYIYIIIYVRKPTVVFRRPPKGGDPKSPPGIYTNICILTSIC